VNCGAICPLVEKKSVLRIRFVRITMPTAIVIVSVGVIIFLSHYFNALFQRTKIPDVLWLFAIGLLIGPVGGLVSTKDFGVLGPVFTTITLVFILFESGIDQRLEPLIASLSGTAKITTYNFIGTCIIAGGMAYINTDLGFVRSLLLGSIIGGTSSAVITTLAPHLPIRNRTKTILILEAAFSDVYTLAIPLTLLAAYQIGKVDVAFVTGQMIAAFLLATLLGVAAAFFWSVLLNRIRSLQNTVFTTPAFVFILYGVVELLNFSGPIAALAFGITLGNIDVLGPPIMRNIISKKPIALNDYEKAFFSETVFLLRTFFFVYIGISVSLQNWSWILLGAFITLALYVARIPIVRLSVPRDTSASDAAYMSVLLPKGLGAAVLASLPAQQGVPGGELIQSVVFSVILCTTLLSTLMTFMLQKTALQRVYRWIFTSFGLPDNGHKTLLIPIALLGLSTALSAQNTPSADTSASKIYVENALRGEYFQVGNTYLQKLTQNVRLRQGLTLVRCDSALLDERQNKAVLLGNVVFEQGDTLKAFGDSAVFQGNDHAAELFGDVVLVNGRQELFTKRLHYDLTNKIATYRQSATLTNGQSQLTSQQGYYHVQDDMAYFSGNVVVGDPEFTLRADTMAFNTALQRVYFLAPTSIAQRNGRMYTEGGFYDLDENAAVFDKNPQYENADQRGKANIIRYNGATRTYTLEGQAVILEPDRTIKADTIRYNDETDQGDLIGNAWYRDSVQEVSGPRIQYDGKNKQYNLSGRGRLSDPPNIIEADRFDFNNLLGNGLAEGNVVWVDSSAETILIAQRVDYNKQTSFVQASGGHEPWSRPVLKSILDADTLFLCADTLSSFVPDTSTGFRTLIGFRDVRIFKSNLQATSDSMSYSTADSVFWFYNLDTLPIVWSDTSQFSADTIGIALRDNKIYRVFLKEKAFVINTPDELLYNQIKGRKCTAFFEADTLRQLLVEGNAEALYFARNEEQAYVGLNETVCSEMRLYFAQNQVDGIRFYTQPRGKFIPMNKPGVQDRRLDGFLWETGRRPRTPLDIF
jgi:NhaP-type Na+/H+ or K+/H+ antiporter/lipopolysaccharide export system protein LptA